MMQRNAYKYPTANVKGAINKGLYIEMWWFEFYDENANVEFAINCCINNPSNNWFGRLLGFKRSCDFITCVAFDDKRRAKEDDYQDGFDASEDEFKINFGNVVFAEAIDETTIRLHGTVKAVGISFDLQFKQALPEIPPINTKISKRKDNYWYHTMMPLANVTGTITMDGETRDVNCHGYHDHDWGSPTKLVWSPWSVATDDDFAIITYTTSGKYGHVSLFLDGKWIDLPVPRVTITGWKEETFVGKGGDIVPYTRPTRFELEAEGKGIRAEYTVREDGGKRFLIDFGFERKRKNIHAPATIAVNYVTGGTIWKDGKVVKEFSGMPSSFQWYEPMDYFKLLF